jgi:hypothetical protein
MMTTTHYTAEQKGKQHADDVTVTDPTHGSDDDAADADNVPESRSTSTTSKKSTGTTISSLVPDVLGLITANLELDKLKGLLSSSKEMWLKTIRTYPFRDKLDEAIQAEDEATALVVRPEYKFLNLVGELVFERLLRDAADQELWNTFVDLGQTMQLAFADAAVTVSIRSASASESESESTVGQTSNTTLVHTAVRNIAPSTIVNKSADGLTITTVQTTPRPSMFGCQALLSACKLGNVKAAAYLLDKKYGDLACQYGQAYYNACRYGGANVLRVLIGHDDANYLGRSGIYRSIIGTKQRPTTDVPAIREKMAILRLLGDVEDSSDVTRRASALAFEVMVSFMELPDLIEYADARPTLLLWENFYLAPIAAQRTTGALDVLKYIEKATGRLSERWEALLAVCNLPTERLDLFNFLYVDGIHFGNPFKPWHNDLLTGASGRGHYGIVKRIFEIIDTTCDQGNLGEPLGAAIRKKDMKMIELLIDRYSKENFETSPRAIWLRFNGYGLTRVYGVVAAVGDVDILNAVVRKLGIGAANGSDLFDCFSHIRRDAPLQFVRAFFRLIKWTEWTIVPEGAVDLLYKACKDNAVALAQVLLDVTEPWHVSMDHVSEAVAGLAKSDEMIAVLYNSSPNKVWSMLAPVTMNYNPRRPTPSPGVLHARFLLKQQDISADPDLPRSINLLLKYALNVDVLSVLLADARIPTALFVNVITPESRPEAVNAIIAARHLGTDHAFVRTIMLRYMAGHQYAAVVQLLRDSTIDVSANGNELLRAAVEAGSEELVVAICPRLTVPLDNVVLVDYIKTMFGYGKLAAVGSLMQSTGTKIASVYTQLHDFAKRNFNGTGAKSSCGCYCRLHWAVPCLLDRMLPPKPCSQTSPSYLGISHSMSSVRPLTVQST